MDGQYPIVLVGLNAKWIHSAFGLRYVRANLGELRPLAVIIESTVKEALSPQGLGNLVARIREYRPRVVALSVYIWNQLACRALLQELAGDGCLLVAGGPEVSHLSADSALWQVLDVVVRGEGELAFRDLCTDWLAGSWQLPVGQGRSTGRPVLIEGGELDLSAVQLAPVLPYAEYSDEDLRQRMVYVESTRGCPFGCEFCLSSLSNGVRSFDQPAFLAAMRELLARGAQRIKFVDRTFNIDMAAARAILELFLEHFRAGAPGFVHFEMVPDRFPPDLREILGQFPAGSLRLELGVQTFNPEAAGNISRRQNHAATIDALSFLRDHTKAIVHADLIAGLPGEDLVSFGRGFDQLWAMRPGEIQLGILKKLPGARLARHDTVFGMVYNPDPPYELLENRLLSRHDVDRLRHFGRLWEKFVNQALLPECRLLLSEQASAFWQFMALSDHVVAHFGRSWGIDRSELLACAREWLSAQTL